MTPPADPEYGRQDEMEGKQPLCSLVPKRQPAAASQKMRFQSWKLTELLKGKATLPSPPQLQRSPALPHLEELSLYLDQQGHQQASMRGERTLNWESGTSKTFRLGGAKDTRSREI